MQNRADKRLVVYLDEMWVDTMMGLHTERSGNVGYHYDSGSQVPIGERIILGVGGEMAQVGFPYLPL